MTRFLLVLSLTLFTPWAIAQEVKTAEGFGEVTYHSDMSPKQAKVLAYERAKIDAIQSVFPGTIVAESHSVTLNSSAGNSSSSFNMTGLSEVKGEWMGDSKDPQYSDPAYDNTTDMWRITCKVKGKVREVKWATPDFKWKLMRNHVEDASEAESFFVDDQLFMTFQAPCDGFLAVYICDERGAAQCIVPNDQDPRGIYPVKGGQQYVFFSDNPKHNNGEVGLEKTQELVLWTNSRIEYDQVYVFFSPNKFRKATNGDRATITDGSGVERTLVGEVPYADFQKWQIKLMSKDTELQRSKRIISIQKKN
ncbi:MAG: hypothetical protein J6W75_06895 [Bacteroidaceae bacterium]|nr:hypothetical protein [Bacteroidaceae bacterium]